MNVKLVLPSEEYKEKIMEYKSIFISYGDSMAGTAGLKDVETFEDWYSNFKNNRFEETVKEGLVPATTFLAVDDNNNLLGMIDIRHRLNNYLMNFGGHIGYSVVKSQRKKGIATKMLSLALIECKRLNIFNVLITCNKENIASAKTIIKNNGVLEDEILENDRITQRYWITLS